MRFWRFVRLAWLCIGGGLLVAGCCWGISTAWFVAHSITADGHVIGLLPSNDENSPGLTRPRFEFKAADGQVYSVDSDTETNPPSFFDGEEVEVRYLPGRPQKARINTLVQLWLGPMIAGVIGLVWLTTGIAWTALVRKRRDREAKKEHEKFSRVERSSPQT